MRKGFILSLDIIMSVAVVTVLLAVSLYYYYNSSEDPFARLQIVRAGIDITEILDYNGDLATLDQDMIFAAMNRLLPVNYNMRIEVTPFIGDSFTVGDPLPGGRFIASGKRVFVVKSDGEIVDYCVAKFWIWLK